MLPVPAGARAHRPSRRGRSRREQGWMRPAPAGPFRGPVPARPRRHREHVGPRLVRHVVPRGVL